MRSQSLSMIHATLLLVALAACAPKTEEAEEPAAPAEPAAAPAAAPAETLEAHAVLAPREGGTESGIVTFSERGGVVTIVAHVEGGAPGPHGFHIHEFGDCSAPDFASAGGHWNPGGAPHGAPTDAERHAGDLGNIVIGADGVGHLELTSDLITVSQGGRTVLDRGVILHEGQDDLVTQPTGAAGARLACGVVTEGGGSEGAESGG